MVSSQEWSDHRRVDYVSWVGENGQEKHRACTEFNVAREYLSTEVTELCLSYDPSTCNVPPPRPYSVFVRWGNNQKTPIAEYLRSDQYKEDVHEKRVGSDAVPLSKMWFLGDMPGQPGLWFRPVIENCNMIATYREFTPEELADPVTAGIMKPEFEANNGELILHVFARKTYKEAGIPIPEDLAKEFGVKETDVLTMSEHRGYVLDPKTGKIADHYSSEGVTQVKDFASTKDVVPVKDVFSGSSPFIVKR